MVANKAGLYIVEPDRKGAAPSKPKDAKAKRLITPVSTWKFMLPGRKKDQHRGWPSSGMNSNYSLYR